ncbi:hypothetical protein ABZ342_27530 [Amycolatopsis sp. NPDC005961]|uniref:hypothetical protein n=1 Tax=Amycolatopsis sp. NPDC005961 TaxID=3156720 RepID=UPI0033EC1808
MAKTLEIPGSEAHPDWESLYRSRADEVASTRPIFTGDIFRDVLVSGVDEPARKNIIILQHPCAMRTDGISLVDRVLVAEIRTDRAFSAREWLRNFKKMPLPLLLGHNEADAGYVALLNSLYFAKPKDLELDHRIACLSQVGVNLLLQRWVHHNSRVIVETFQYQEVSSSAFEEVELIEEWCDERLEDGDELERHAREALAWLREDSGNGKTWQELLADPQTRSTVRRQMRSKLRELGNS